MTDQSCLNCGERLRGPFCHACGQPVKGMIRHFRSVIGDALDTVLEYDGRIWRTLLPLYFRPGRITLDFLAGRRMRFVTPFRLAFVMLVLAFLALQFTVTPGSLSDPDDQLGIYSAATVADVEAARDRALAGLEDILSQADAGDRAQLEVRLETARRALHDEAERRIEWLEAAAAARSAGREPPPEPIPRPLLYIADDNAPWSMEGNPLEIAWLPESANRQINAWIERGLVNARQAQQDPGRYVDAFLGLLPAALFVLMPIFALLLKLFYAFSRRLYMEHMLVTLHSHAFLGLALLVTTGLESLASWAPATFGLQTGLGGLHDLAMIWTPIYLLIMQRRVYAQGWPLTLIKFGVLGAVYALLLGVALAVSAAVTLIRG